MSLFEYSPCWARKVAALYQALRKLHNMQFIFFTWKSVTKPSYMTYPHIQQSQSLSLHILPKSCRPCNCIMHARQHSVSYTSGGTLQAHRLDYILYLLQRCDRRAMGRYSGLLNLYCYQRITQVHSDQLPKLTTISIVEDYITVAEDLPQLEIQEVYFVRLELYSVI